MNPAVTNETLNFQIPAAWLTPGAHTFTVQVVCDDPSGKITLAQTVTWTWAEHAPIRVRALYMKYFSGSDDLLLDYARQALDFLPAPLTDIGIAAPRWMSHSYDLTNNDDWDDLLDDLEDAWDDADEASNVRWLGIIPSVSRSQVGVDSPALLASRRSPLRAVRTLVPMNWVTASGCITSTCPSARPLGRSTQPTTADSSAGPPSMCAPVPRCHFRRAT